MPDLRDTLLKIAHHTNRDIFLIHKTKNQVEQNLFLIVICLNKDFLNLICESKLILSIFTVYCQILLY